MACYFVPADFRESVADRQQGVSAFLPLIPLPARIEFRQEFGRRPAENGSGTDHGTASAHLIVGPAVKGGRYGDPPSLAALDANGNPAMTVDFRTYFSTVLQGWLGVDPEPVVGPGFAPLPLFQ